MGSLPCLPYTLSSFTLIGLCTFSDLKANWAGHTQTVLCQSLHGHIHRKYFPVIHPISVPHTINTTTGISSGLASHATVTAQGLALPQAGATVLKNLEELDLCGFNSWQTVQVSDPSVSSFLRNSGILHHVEECLEYANHSNLATVNSPEGLAQMNAFISHWFNARMSNILGLNFTLRRVAMSRST